MGRELGADYIVEGSVRRSVDRVRICAQLVDAEHQTHLWAEPYDRTLSDVLSVQCEVAQAIAREILLVLRLKKRRTTRLDRARLDDVHLLLRPASAGVFPSCLRSPR